MVLALPLRLSWFLRVLLAGTGALSACSSRGHEFRPDNAVALHRLADPGRPAAGPLIDLPSALHLRPAEFSARFGQPQPLAPGFVDPGKALADGTVPADSLVLFRPQGLSMVVSFRPGAGLVQDVLLLGTDEVTLMQQATLLPAAANYLLLPVFDSRRAGRLLGLRVIPK